MSGPRLARSWRAGLWVVLASGLFVSMGLIAKILGQRLDSLQVSFARALFGFLLLLPLILRERAALFATPRWKMHVLRGIFGTLGMICGFYAVTHLPLAEATALGFTRPLFMVVLAALVLHEAVRARRWTATVIGFLGVLVMLRPGAGVVQFAALVALFGALCAATVGILIKQLVESERPAVVLAWLGLVGTIVTGIPAAFVWQWPTLTEIALMIVMGTVGTLSQLCLMRGYRLADASFLAPFDYARLPFAAAFGFLFFSEVPDLWALLGAAIIASSTLYIAYREARLGRPGGPPHSSSRAGPSPGT